MTTPHESSLFTLDGIIYMVFRRKWLILLGILAGGAAAAYIYLNAPTTYVSEAKLLVRYVTDDTSLDLASDGGRVMRPDSRGGSILNSEAAILQSRSLAAKVVRDIGAEVIFPPKEGKPAPSENVAAAALLKSLLVTVPRHSSIIHLAYHGPTPEVSQRVLDRLIDYYLEAHQEIHGAAASYGFFSQKTDQLRSDLRATEAELQELKQQTGVVDVEASKTMLVQRIGEIRHRIEEQQGMIASAEARAGLLQEQIGLAPDAFEGAEAGAKDAVDPLEKLNRQQSLRELALLRERQLRLLATYTAESAPLKSVSEQIAKAEIKAGVHTAGAAATTRPAMVSDVSSTEDIRKELILERSRMVSSQALLNLLMEQQEATEEEIKRLNQNESRIVQLERQQELQDAAYRRFADALDAAKNQLALAPDQLSNIFEVEPATLPLRPELPESLKKQVLMAGVCGMGVFGGLAFLLELVAMRSLRRPAEIERILDTPILMAFPRAPAFKRPVDINGNQQLLPASNDSPDESPQATCHLADPVQAYYDTLLHRIQLSGVFAGEIPHLIGVVGCTEGAGTTTVATGLALTMSRQEGAKTLLIDGDLGKGGAHKVLGVAEAVSLPRVLLDGIGSSSRVQPGLYLLSAGNGEHREALPSLGRRFRDLVGFLKDSKYTSVVLDLPPVHDTSPTLQMAGLLDGVVLVVESERISRDRARSALKMLRDSNANVIGVVFNKKRDYVPGWLDQSG